MSFTMVAGASACKPGQIGDVTHVATTIAIDAQEVLSVVEIIAHTFFGLHPMPQVQPQAEKLIQDCHLGLSAAMHAIDGATQLDQGAIDNAFSAFRDSFRQLQALLVNVGAVTPSGDGRFSAARSGVSGAVYVAEPMAMHYSVRAR